ncbi:MAG TPA: ATP-binding protein [Bryobacteraceae bacterium]|nr:ATP-binding protein [Bryobacteraceae bacterium]
MSEIVTAEELLALPLFEGENPETAHWVAARMRMITLAAGEQFVRAGEPATEFMIVLTGEIHFRRDAIDEILVAPAGQATGILPFSRMKTWTGRGWAAQDTRVAAMDAGCLHELVYRAPLLAQRLVSEMTERTRRFTRMEEGANRLLALGRLAAGLAHELNNPASAAVRSAARLRELLSERRRYGLAFRGEVLSAEARQHMEQLGESLADCAATLGILDPLERSDREADLSDWLESVDIPGDLAPALVDAGLTIDRLRPLIGLASTHILTLGLRILVADHEILCLTQELDEASRRISDLVQAVKTYSYMDKSPVADVDVEQGIDVTLRMFQHQLKHGIQLNRHFAGNLPKIRANGSELNQIWTNLIDNAIDAVELLPKDTPRSLTVKTCAEPTGILVELSDNGPGIPAEAQRRIFEPFFTTKPVGEGTGLGLDIVQRIVRAHRGSIRVDSAPGRTVFQIRLPNG